MQKLQKTDCFYSPMQRMNKTMYCASKVLSIFIFATKFLQLHLKRAKPSYLKTYENIPKNAQNRFPYAEAVYNHALMYIEYTLQNLSLVYYSSCKLTMFILRILCNLIYHQNCPQEISFSCSHNSLATAFQLLQYCF